MLKKNLRLLAGLLFLSLIVTAFAPTIPLLHAINASAAQAVSGKITTDHRPRACTGAASDAVPISSTLPVVTIHPLHGVGGSYIYLRGQSFTPKELVQIYWGDASGLLEGSATTDAYGRLTFSFYAPARLLPGTYPITVLRADSSTVTTEFQVFTPCIAAPADRSVEQPILIALDRFQADEMVTISWNANGGQQIGTIQVDDTGYGYATLTPPFASPGSYTLSATGNSSGLQISQPFAVDEPFAWVYGNTNGLSFYAGVSNYAPDEVVQITWNVRGGEVLVSLTTDSSGYGFATFVPPFTSPGVYTATATGLTSGFQTTTDVYVENPRIDATAIYNGQQMQISVSGFVPGELVKLSWNAKSGETIGTISTNSLGQGTFNFLPPYTSPGTYVMKARGSSSGLSGSTFIWIIPATMSLVGGTGTYHAGDTIQAQLIGFAPLETVTITINVGSGEQLAVVQTDASGAASAQISLPFVHKGFYTLSAIGATSGQTARAYLNLISGIMLSSSTAAPGSTITVTGAAFSRNETITIDIRTVNKSFISTPVSVKTDALGGFTISQAVPTNYKKTTYHYIVYAANASMTEHAQTPFAFVQPSITASAASVHPGDVITVSGQGFVANETVTVLWNYGTPQRVLVASVTTASDGSFSATFTVPSIGISGSNVTVYVTDISRQYKAATTVYESGS